ncbi:Elongation factor 1-gamma, partial [Perkinsus olseni]
MTSYVAEITAVPVIPSRHLGCDEIVVSAFPGHYKTKRIQLTAAMAGASVEFVDAREVQFVHCAVQKYPMARVIQHSGPSRREWLIFTTPAICRYIARLRRDCSLLGIGSEMEAAVDSTMAFITQELEVPIALLIYRSLGAISPGKMVAKRASREIEGALKRMNLLLSEEGSNGFLVPGTASVSLADIFAITVLSDGISHDLVTIDETDCPQVALWLERMAQLPLVQKFVFGQSDSFRTALGLAVDASTLSSASEREGRKAKNTPRRGTARTVHPVVIPSVAADRRNDDTIRLSERQNDVGVVASKVRRWEGKVSGSSTAAPVFLVTKKAPSFPSEAGAQRPTGSLIPSGGSENGMSTSRGLDDSECRPFAGSGRAESGPPVHAGSSPLLLSLETSIGAKTNGAPSNRRASEQKNLASSVFMKLLPSPSSNRTSQLREARGAALRHGRAGEDGPGRTARPKAMRLRSSNSKLPANSDERRIRRPLAGRQDTETTPSGGSGGSGVGVKESLKVTKSARGRLEGGSEASEGMASAAALISLPIRRRSGGTVELSAVVERQQDGHESSYHIPTELWPQGDYQTVGAGLRGEDLKTAVMGEADSNSKSDFVEDKSSGRGIPDPKASQGLSEPAEHPVGKFNEDEECDRGPLEAGRRMGEEQDTESSLDQHLIKLMTEGQHFGRNSDRRRLPTAGRFGTLSLKMEPESPTVAERAMWSAPVPPPEVNEAPVPPVERAASRAASDLQREAA